MTGLRTFVKTSVRFTGHGNIQLPKLMIALPEEQNETIYKYVKMKVKWGVQSLHKNSLFKQYLAKYVAK